MHTGSLLYKLMAVVTLDSVNVINNGGRCCMVSNSCSIQLHQLISRVSVRIKFTDTRYHLHLLSHAVTLYFLSSLRYSLTFVNNCSGIKICLFKYKKMSERWKYN